MKTAVSLPDDLFDEAEAAAARLGLNRSQLYAKALERFLAAQGPDPVVERYNELADELNDDSSARNFTRRAAHQLSRSGESEW